MRQRKGDCIHACKLVMSTDQVHLWSVILSKRTEIGQCPPMISWFGYTKVLAQPI